MILQGNNLGQLETGYRPRYDLRCSTIAGSQVLDRLYLRKSLATKKRFEIIKLRKKIRNWVKKTKLGLFNLKAW